MARKRLSDLLREEVQKPTDNDANTLASDNGKQKSAGSARSRKPAAGITPQPKAAAPAETKSPESEAELKELKLELERSQQREASLKQELEALQTSLDQQDSLVKTLKADLSKADSLKGELEQAKKAALQLAEENTQLRETINSAKQQKPAEVAAPPPKPTATPHHTALSQSEIMKRQTASLTHPVFPVGKSPGYLSDQDLGWVD